MANKNRRNVRNLLINPDAQVRYGTMFLAASILVHALTTILMIQIYMAYRADLIETDQISVGAIFIALIVLYLLLYGFSFVLGLMISHRLYGPMVNFEKGLVRLNQGDYSSRIVLRKTDDTKLKEIAELINQLAEKLDSKKS